MQLTLYRISLPLRHVFTISRGSQTTQEALVVALTEGDCTGLGEVTANNYYGRTLELIVAAVEQLRPVIEKMSCGEPDELWAGFRTSFGDNTFAQCALDLAVHDLWGRLQGKSLVDVWGLDRHRIPDSSFTIGIDAVDTMVARLREQPGWSCYKIKLGTSADLEILRALRAETSATFRVDANCAWTAEETIQKSIEMEKLGVEFIEQPLRPEAPDADHRRVYEQSRLPVIADESCLVEGDVARCQGRFHGINVKLCKCGGLTPALRMLTQARQLGMRTMVGCMVESSIGISAAAQLLPLLDYADLDGAVLLRDEPASGVRIERGKIHWSDLPGTGAVLLPDRLHEFLLIKR